MSWSFLGPMPIAEEGFSGPGDASGRIAAIAVHPTDPDTAYIAAATGGVWKTVDGGFLWEPQTDELPNLNHGCVAIDPSAPETIYVGTGEYLTGATGDGMFRSIDGGATWDRVATAADVGSTCSRIIVDPGDPLRIHVTGNIGYVRSNDGGLTWNVLKPSNASDLVMRPNDPLTLYMGHVPDGIYRSSDGGTTWTLLINGLPDIETNNVVLDISRTNPNVLFATMGDANESFDIAGIFKTADGGNSWTQATGTIPSLGNVRWNLCIGIDPADDDVVYLGGFKMYRTTNGGNSWSSVSTAPLGGTLHVDHQALAFGPDGTVWAGNDGGIWKSSDAAQTWMNLNDTLGVTQFYAVTIHPTDEDRLIGGSQDNGSSERGSAGNVWTQLRTGDTGSGAFDPDDPTLRYTAGGGMSILRHHGETLTNITGPWSGDSTSGNYPFLMDPNDGHTLLVGTNRVWRTTDAHSGANWTAISGTNVGVVTALAAVAGVPDTIYSGNNAGQVFVTTNAATWVGRSLGVGLRWVSEIEVYPDDPAQACVSIADGTVRVMCTDDMGDSWIDRSGSLPAGLWASTLAVDWRFDPPILYVGTGVGVYLSTDNGATWVKDGSDFPNCRVTDLAIDTFNNAITAGTYGRGAWRANLAECGNGEVEIGERCDTAIPAGQPGGCPGDCESVLPCTQGTLVDAGTCQARCECDVNVPQEASHPHNRRKNRYISFNPNQNGAGSPVAFRVELKTIKLGSCNDDTGASVDFCREDRGAADCNSCVGGAGGPCLTTAIHCSTGGGVCTPTGALCVNDLPHSGGSNVGEVWWVGPEHPSGNGVHLLVTEPFRKESTNWPDPTHVGDCEIVPQASYGVRAVNVASGNQSAELLVETVQFVPAVGPDPFWWADSVGALVLHCDGDFTLPTCAVASQETDCGPGVPCARCWTLPNGSVNFDDVNAALTLVAPPGVGVPAEMTWVDLHPVGGELPPNGTMNSSDLQQFIFGFGGFPYTGFDPKDCDPSVIAWP